MQYKNKIKILLKQILPFGALLVPFGARAHENYVLTKQQIGAGMGNSSLNVFDALKSSVNLRVGLTVAILSAVGISLYFLFQHSNLGRKFDARLQKLEPLGHVFLRWALGASFLASAFTNSYLGPEISLHSLPFSGVIQILLVISGVFLIFGFFTEIVGLVGLVIIFVATYIYKDYMVTYFNYFGELLAYLLFGSRIFSVDKRIFGTILTRFGQLWEKYEILIIRVTYGISILYPAITIKLLHPSIIVEIVNQYHINNYHWLFPHDPLLVALGTGLAQIAVGICLIIGFETRLNTFITFVLMTMSVLFFKESVWPHLILLALALYLMINDGGKIKIDTWFDRKMIQWRNGNELKV